MIRNLTTSDRSPTMMAPSLSTDASKTRPTIEAYATRATPPGLKSTRRARLIRRRCRYVYLLSTVLLSVLSFRREAHKLIFWEQYTSFVASTSLDAHSWTVLRAGYRMGCVSTSPTYAPTTSILPSPVSCSSKIIALMPLRIST
jgi:hypothetical protein